MPSATAPMSFAALLGSVRRQRMGIRAAKLVIDALQSRGFHRVHCALSGSGSLASSRTAAS